MHSVFGELKHIAAPCCMLAAWDSGFSTVFMTSSGVHSSKVDSPLVEILF